MQNEANTGAEVSTPASYIISVEGFLARGSRVGYCSASVDAAFSTG